MSTLHLPGEQPAPARRQSAPRFPSVIRLRVPASLPAFVDRAAERSMMTSSQYIRESVINQLRADGIDLAQAVDAA